MIEGAGRDFKTVDEAPTEVTLGFTSKAAVSPDEIVVFKLFVAEVDDTKVIKAALLLVQDL
jgi:hypothetical protein